MIYVKIKSISGVIPKYMTEGSAGCDIDSTEKHVLQPGERHLFSTGIYLEVPKGHECQIRPRSGLAFKHGVTVLNSPGTIDCDYRGEVKVLLINHGQEPFEISIGDRIAQLVFAAVKQAKFVKGDLSSTDRSVGGFGSTGIK
jgi:dUTP pyrophosphatase